MQKLKITVLNDNIAGRWFRSEHGLSFLIEADQTLLFDTSSSSDLIAYNAQILNIDLQQIETIVFSHGHDHLDKLIDINRNRNLIVH